MKFVNVLFFVILINGYAFSQSDSIALLSCNTWGKPDWTKFEKYSGHKFYGTHGAIREFDRNIEAISPAFAEVYGDDVFFRWILTDTTISYHIKVISNSQVIYTAESNKCGVQIPFGMLLQNGAACKLQIDVERAKKKWRALGHCF